VTTLSIILPTYNRGFSIEFFLKSLLRQSYNNWELIVVDDASQDNTPQIALKYANNDQRINLYRLKNHKGLPAARNAGVGISRGELIFFGEDDITFNDENTLKILVDTYLELRKSYKVGAVGPRLEDSGYKWLNDVVKIGPITGWIYHNFGYDTEKVVEVPILHACSVISKEVFRNVGGYDEQSYVGTHAKEEVDFYYRIRSGGYKLFFQPKSVTWHNHINCGGCETNNLLKVYYYEYRNSMLFFLRFYGFLQLFKVFLHPVLRMIFPKKVL